MKDHALEEDPELEREALFRKLAHAAEQLRPERTGSVNLCDTPLARLGIYVAWNREHFRHLDFTRPLLAIVCRGHKDVRYKGHRFEVPTGSALVLPGPMGLSITNVPHEGEYRAFVMDVSPEVGAQLQQHHPSLCVSPAFGAFSADRPHVMKPNRSTLLALLHYCQSIPEVETHATVLRHRLEDVLLSLSVQYRGLSEEPAPRSHFRQDPILAVRQWLRRGLAETPRATHVARQFGVSEATLRRQLSSQGTTLRQLLLEERMSLAHSLLADSRLAISEVAQRCGYTSPAKFSRQYRHWAGVPRTRARADRAHL
ncbi:AraC family transcriptional regulator [Corallococcus sp. M34]|uniref:helix-turn-helix transcriptional regulator n=1 Tax=Citreicoccus inhibens TaxID=2849499 RepID=UPI001C222284|nr:AraC family transcriptional regulator [Citreicoccus inhibens]MBU8895392.1 AraC family transcriptional regulator [Citreicoccus inhibens]